ncbi:MAG TPA: hypothetical protein VGL81_13520 [Polyangiaceae bacterium]|jgi:hypothetical protein
MRRDLAVAVLVAGALGSAPSLARADDVVRVTGHTFHGTVVEARPRVLVRIRLADGAEMTVPWSEVLAIEHADGTPLPLAAPPRATEPAGADLPRHWYGWQILLVDGGSLALLPLGGAGLVTYAVGPAVVHAAHGRAAPAIGSVLLRVGLPLVLGLAGLWVGTVATRPDQNSNDIATGPIFGGALGLLAGFIGAMVVDDAVLAWEPVKPSPASKPGAAAPIRLVPRLALAGDAEHGRGGWMGLAVAF